MRKIIQHKILHHPVIEFTFDDGKVKAVDFSPFIKDNFLTQPLSDPTYFSQVALYPDKRGILWPNAYDFCTDYLYGYVGEEITIS